jgi:hypothetical protein
MVYFQTKNPYMVKFWKMLVYFTVIWNILWPFGIFFGHFGNVVVIWYIFPVLVYCVKENLATLTTTFRIFRSRAGVRKPELGHVRGVAA